jgi:hypothetical protein
MKANSLSKPNGPGSPYDPFPTPRIFPDKWDLSELVAGYQPGGDFTPEPPALSASGLDSNPLIDGTADESSANAL